MAFAWRWGCVLRALLWAFCEMNTGYLLVDKTPSGWNRVRQIEESWDYGDAFSGTPVECKAVQQEAGQSGTEGDLDTALAGLMQILMKDPSHAGALAEFEALVQSQPPEVQPMLREMLEQARLFMPAMQNLLGGANLDAFQ